MSCMPQSPYQNPFPGAHSTTFFVQNDSRLYVAKWTFMKELLMPTPICVRVCVRVCVCVRVVGRFVAYFLWLPPRDRDGDQSRSLNRALAWPGHRVFPSPRPAPSSYNTINCQVGRLAVKMQGHNSLSLLHQPPTLPPIPPYNPTIYGKNENFNLSTPYVGSEQRNYCQSTVCACLPLKFHLPFLNFFLGKYKTWFTAISCVCVCVYVWGSGSCSSSSTGII